MAMLLRLVHTAFAAVAGHERAVVARNAVQDDDSSAVAAVAHEDSVADEEADADQKQEEDEGEETQQEILEESRVDPNNDRVCRHSVDDRLESCDDHDHDVQNDEVQDEAAIHDHDSLSDCLLCLCLAL